MCGEKAVAVYRQVFLKQGCMITVTAVTKSEKPHIDAFSVNCYNEGDCDKNVYQSFNRPNKDAGDGSSVSEAGV